MSINAVSSSKLSATSASENNQTINRAAVQFERMLLRTMLSQLEKSAHLGAKGSAASGGSSVYSTMVVDALADAVANAGGIGLAEKIADSMQDFGDKP